MKVRKGFVTNSSSSSFIIAYKDIPELDQETITRYPFLKNYNYFIKKILLSRSEYSETTEGEIYSTQKEVERWILDWYGCRNDTLEDVLKEDEYAAEQYKEAMEYINKGYHILVKDVDYCDNIFCDIIHSLKDEENFIVLEEDA